VRQHCSVWQVHSAVCGSALGSVWQCARQCAAVRGGAAVCVKCGSVRQYCSVWHCAAVCSSVRQCGSARAAVRQCVLGFVEWAAIRGGVLDIPQEVK
jgi:hypothetical protein